MLRIGNIFRTPDESISNAAPISSDVAPSLSSRSISSRFTLSISVIFSVVTAVSPSRLSVATEDYLFDL